MNILSERQKAVMNEPSETSILEHEINNLKQQILEKKLQEHATYLQS